MSDSLLRNYHTHTPRCNHASGSEEEYILRAIERGTLVLGFSDHSTYLFSSPFFSAHRMKNEEIDEYVSTLYALREKYKDKIELHIGFEVEYYPNTWEASLAEWKKHGIEYLILGQHYVGIEEFGARSTFKPVESEEELKNYVFLITECMKTGKISYVAHPDAINFVGDRELFLRETEKIIDTALDLDLPLEYNMLGLNRKRFYPQEDFWQMVSKKGAKVILGCDAHETDDVANPKTIKLARENLKKLGITNIVDKLEFKPL